MNPENNCYKEINDHNNEDLSKDTDMYLRPSLKQLKAIVEFMQKHPQLNQKKLSNGVKQKHDKFTKQWRQLAKSLNSTEGITKPVKGWMKFWTDKKKSVLQKKKYIDEGKQQGALYPIEQEILNLIEPPLTSKRKRNVKQEPRADPEEMDSSKDDDDDDEDIDLSFINNSKSFSTEAEERQLNIMEKLVEVMDHQASAMTQMAQASLSNSKSLQRLAEAAHIQALAVDRLASTFENITGSVHAVRNAIVGIDYTMKTCYSTNATQRQNSNLFS